MQRARRLGLWTAAAVVGGCCGAAPPPAAPAEPAESTVQKIAKTPETPPVEEVEMKIEPPIWSSAEAVKADCDAGLESARKKRTEILEAAGPRTRGNTLEPINDLLIEVYSLLSMTGLHANVHPEETVRDAAEACQQEVMKFVSAFELDRDIYDATVAVDMESLDPMAKRFTEHLLRDYRLSGVDKDEATRKRLAEIKEEMVRVGQDFDRVIRDDQRAVSVTEKETEGLPEELLAPRKQADGTYRFTTDGPDFMPVSNYAKSEDVRKRMLLAYLQRAYPANDENLKTLLALRYEYATLLGYTDWAAYNAVDAMAKDKETIATFIDKVADIARPRMKSDLKDMLKRKRKDIRKADAIHVWDRFYYANLIKAERFGVDAKALRDYFEYGAVIQGVLDVSQALFGVKFEEVPGANVWHEDVKAYNVMEDGVLVGRFYLDMHPRPGKYGHAAEFGMITGIKGRMLPSASLVCNFPKPSGDTPALLEHDQVTTIFHEFGHLMHQILAGRHEWVTLSGISCEGDFIEAPSQLYEHWGWDWDILSRFSKHYKTGEVIPKELVAKMKAADEFGRGAHVMRQMYYAGLSLTYHASAPANMDLLDVVKAMQKKYSPYPYEKDTYVYASFGHLEGYSSSYYTYMWSLSISEDLFSRFEKEGLMNPETDKAYRDAIITPGGTVDAADMVKQFLGRESVFDALKSYLSEQE